MGEEEARGMLLNGRYRLCRLIGQGSMGEVYEAADEKKVGRIVAIKLLRLKFSDYEDLIARLEREAAFAKHVVSPHVARVLCAGRNRQGRAWIAFEHLVGESLDARLQREHAIPFRDVAWMIEHALLGLAAAHDVGVVHRDVKPGNLFLETSGPRLRVLDFGVAKRVPGSPLTSASLLTALGEVVGTPTYMSPEQLEDATDIDARTDVYSVGLVAYRVITGQLPFNVDLMTDQKRTGKLASLAQAGGPVWPDALEAWFRQASATRREERFSTAKAALVAWRSTCAEVMS